MQTTRKFISEPLSMAVTNDLFQRLVIGRMDELAGMDTSRCHL